MTQSAFAAPKTTTSSITSTTWADMPRPYPVAARMGALDREGRRERRDVRTTSDDGTRGRGTHRSKLPAVFGSGGGGLERRWAVGSVVVSCRGFLLPLVLAGCAGAPTPGSRAARGPSPGPAPVVEPTPPTPAPEPVAAPVHSSRPIPLAHDPCLLAHVSIRAVPGSCRCVLRPIEEGPPERDACARTAREAGWGQLRVTPIVKPSKRGGPVDVTVVLENAGTAPATLHFDDEHDVWRRLHPALVEASDEHDERVDVPQGTCSSGSTSAAPKPHSVGLFVRTSFMAVVLPPGGKVVFETQWPARERIFRRDASATGRAAEIARDLDPCGVVDGVPLDPGPYHIAYDLGLIAPTSDGLHRVQVDVDVP